MKTEAQRIAILKEMGWTETEPWLDGRRCFERADSNSGWNFDDLPDYLNDLNAMHEAEEVMIGKNRSFKARYRKALIATADYSVDNQQPYWRATAAQRAEAFLKTLNKWKDKL